jgi:hypothetical protein
MSGFGAPVAFEINEQGEAVLTTDGMGYQRSLVAGDSITFTVQGTGADFDAKAAAFSFVDLDIVPDAQDSQGVRIDGAATNDWGSGLSQVVTLVNEGNGGIQNWAVELNLPAGRDIDITSVWGATVTREADGDLLFLALDYNASVATGGSAGFGFVATMRAGRRWPSRIANSPSPPALISGRDRNGEAAVSRRDRKRKDLRTNAGFRGPRVVWQWSVPHQERDRRRLNR